VIVPATNRPLSLARCLAAIEVARGRDDEVVVVTEPPFSGPARARNDGAARATGDVLVFVDADVEVHRDALERIAATLADPGVDAVFGSYDDEVATRGIVSAFRNLLHHHVHHEGAGAATTFWAGVGAVRRDRFVAAGGFDAVRYTRPSIEDVELGGRLSAAGSQIVLDPAIQGTHLKQWSLLEMLRTDFASRGVPWVTLLLRGGVHPGALNAGWRHRLSALASLGAAGAVVRRRPVVAGGALAALVALNRSFYGLLARRLGAPSAAAGVGLHALHLIAASAAVPAGLLAHWRARR
jgi:hypothetical protein